MDRFFGRPQFARVGKLFQDLPLEALDRSVTGLNDAYATNMERFNAVEASINAIQASEADDFIKQERIKNIQDRMKRFADTDGFENADRFVASLANEVIGDRELQLISENYSRQLDDEKMARDLRAQGINAIDARNFYNGENFSSVTVGEDGQRTLNTYRGGIIRPGEYDTTKTKLFDQMPQRGGTYYVDGPNGSREKRTWTGIREKDIADYTNEALKRYKSTDEYQTELIDLQVQGYSPEEADAMIANSVTATGMERVGTRSDSQLYGYMNPNAGRRNDKTEQPTRNSTKFIRQAKTTSVSDPNGIWSSIGIGGTDKAGIPSAGFSTVQPSGKEEDVVLNQYYKISNDNSDTSDSTVLQTGNNLFKGVKAVSEQGFVWDDSEGEYSNQLAMFGEGAPGDLGKSVAKDAVPEVDETGKYYVKDNEGNKRYLKPRNFKKYMDGDGNMYYAPMNRQEELQEFGSENITNARPIELGAQRGTYGATAVDNYDEGYIASTLNNISLDPNQSRKYGQVVVANLQNQMAGLQAQVDSGAISIDEAQNLPVTKIYRNLENVMNASGGNPASMLAYMNGRIKEHKNSNQNTLDAETTEMAKILNNILLDYEASGLQDLTPKQSSVNLYDRDSNSFSGLLDE